MIENYSHLKFRDRAPEEELVFSGRRIIFRDLARHMISEAHAAGFVSDQIPDLERSVTVAESEEVVVFRVGSLHYLWDQEIAHLIELSEWPILGTSSCDRKEAVAESAHVLGVWQAESSPSLSDRVVKRLGRITINQDGSGMYHRPSGDRSMTWVLVSERGRENLVIQSHRGSMVYEVIEASVDRLTLRGPNSLTEVVYKRTNHQQGA